jgi:hypothetical protein
MDHQAGAVGGGGVTTKANLRWSDGAVIPALTEADRSEWRAKNSQNPDGKVARFASDCFKCGYDFAVSRANLPKLPAFLECHELRFAGSHVSFRSPVKLTCSIDLTGENQELGIAIYGHSVEELNAVFVDQMKLLWEEYALEDDANLDEGAKVLKAKLLGLVVPTDAVEGPRP